MTATKRWIQLWTALGGLLLATMMTGCGIAPTSDSASAPKSAPASGSISGRAFGGQQPVAGARVYLMAVGTQGYGSAATSLLSGSGVSTDPQGRGYVSTSAQGLFTITGDYNCPSSTTLVYLLAAGGNPGLASGTDNEAIMLAAALGNCQILKANAATTFLNVNEVTTVAAAYGLAPFGLSAYSIGASPTNAQGIMVAFNSAGKLADVNSGNARTVTPAANAAVPQALINTLANALAACVNSDGSNDAGSPCNTLLSATAVNNTPAADIFQAALAIVQDPVTNVASIFNLGSGTPPFEPSLGQPPNDWTVALQYAGGGVHTPQALAVDAAGNVWVANANNVLTEVSALDGSFVTGASGLAISQLDAPSSLAIDTTGSLWIANCAISCSGSGNTSTAVHFSPASGAVVVAADASLNGSYAVAVSGDNHPWIGNALGSTLTEFSVDGSQESAVAASSSLLFPTSLAVNPAGSVFAVSPGGNALAAFTSTGAPDAADSYQGAALNEPYAVALDGAGRQWVVNHAGSSLSVLADGTPLLSSPLTGGGLSLPNDLAIDGAGRVWITNANGAVSEFGSDGSVLSPAAGLRGDLAYPNGIAIDASGNLWMTACGQYCVPGSTSAGSVVEIIGAAAPVLTPLAAAEAANSLAARP